MRAWILVAVLGGAALSASACREDAPAALAGDGQLILEVGQPHRSLAASMRRLGIEPQPPARRQQSVVVEAPPPSGRPQDDEPRAQPEPAQREPAPRGPKRPDPRPEPAPTFFVVELGARETLSDLAKRHLGSGRRFKEIMLLNGWNDRQACRLQIGQKVKIPIVDADAAAPGASR